MAEMAELKRRPNDPGEDALLVPTGTPLYESLSAQVISYDRLLATLGRGGYSGYVRVIGTGVNGILLFRNGRMIDCLWRARDGEVRQGEAAETSARGLLDSGEAVVDIVDLPAELVDSLHSLASGAATYPEMFASWVNLEGLVAFLRERRFVGTVSVRSKSGGGVLMLRQGDLEGAFTTNSRELSTNEAEVLKLTSDPEARIEVRGADAATLQYEQRQPEQEREAEPAIS